MFRFTIRDVLWLTVVVALVIGTVAYYRLLVENRRLQQIINAQEDTIESLTKSLQILLAQPAGNSN
jgi:hypothetical protein